MLFKRECKVKNNGIFLRTARRGKFMLVKMIIPKGCFKVPTNINRPYEIPHMVVKKDEHTYFLYDGNNHTWLIEIFLNGDIKIHGKVTHDAINAQLNKPNLNLGPMEDARDSYFNYHSSYYIEKELVDKIKIKELPGEFEKLSEKQRNDIFSIITGKIKKNFGDNLYPRDEYKLQVSPQYLQYSSLKEAKNIYEGTKKFAEDVAKDDPKEILTKNKQTNNTDYPTDVD